MKCPLKIVEEHHEVFPAWLAMSKRARRSNAPPMTLLRFDSHADMEPGCFSTDLRQLPEIVCETDGETECPERINQIVRNEFHFDDFVLPAVYLGVFDRIIWQRPAVLFGDTSFSEQKYVRSWQREGKCMIFGNGRSEEPDAKHFVWEVGSVLSPQRDIDVLDIEYDYFYCTHSPCVAQRLEITEAEYRRYEQDAYHFARLHFRTVAEERHGRFEIVFYPYNVPFPHPLELDDASLSASVHRFCDAILDVGVKPKFITFCRAVHSGYCRRKQAEVIETILLNRLRGLYE